MVLFVWLVLTFVCLHRLRTSTLLKVRANLVAAEGETDGPALEWRATARRDLVRVQLLERLKDDDLMVCCHACIFGLFPTLLRFELFSL